jgi:hypothetical protein
MQSKSRDSKHQQIKTKQNKSNDHLALQSLPFQNSSCKHTLIDGRNKYQLQAQNRK